MSYAEDIEKTVNEHKVVVYSKTYCSYSNMAKNSLKAVGGDFHAIELDLRNDTEAYQNALMKISGVRTVPQVFIEGKFVGGGTDIKQLQETGKLAAMLQ